MNKLQYIKLLEIRGITDLNGLTIAQAIRNSGGDPTDQELIKVNELCMIYYIDKYQQEQLKNNELLKTLNYLKERDVVLTKLEEAGVDNWEGYNI